MADKSQKPRRDLRARLGRTITPGKGQGGTPPPAGVAAPPAGIGSGPIAGIDVAPPPFARPDEPVDPFAAAAPAQQQQVVRLEFDDRLVSDEEVGKKRGRLRTALLAGAVALVLGCGIGWGIGAMLAQRSLLSRTVHDAQVVYHSVDTASGTLTTVQRHLATLQRAANGNLATNTPPSVDYRTIQRLQGIEKPFSMSAFTSLNYNALGAETVHNLFTYVMNIERIWAEIEALNGETAANRRAELNEGAADAAAQTNFAIVLVRTEGVLQARVVLGQPAPPPEPGQPAPTPPGPRLRVRQTRGGNAVDLQIYSGSPSQQINDTPTYAILVDGEHSPPLRDQRSAFVRYREHLQQIKALVDQTAATQGAMIQAIANAITSVGGTPGPPEE